MGGSSEAANSVFFCFVFCFVFLSLSLRTLRAPEGEGVGGPPSFLPLLPFFNLFLLFFTALIWITKEEEIIS